jgi:hypothetical protein
MLVWSSNGFAAIASRFCKLAREDGLVEQHTRVVEPEDDVDLADVAEERAIQ